LLYGFGTSAGTLHAMELWLLLFWGGVWGALLAATLARLDGARLVLAAIVFGAVVPTLVGVLVLAPLKGQPTVTGVVPFAVLAAALVNGAWGLGTGLGLAFFGRRRPRPDNQ
jgi:hypothetical protein